MAKTELKKLLFIKAPTEPLRSVESFLAKRNFKVFSEIDVKLAIDKVIECEPDFIFLAWDHSDPAIMELPKLIIQASNALVVPYITSTKRDATRKLNVCPLNPKLYPPVSGPAIERLILKAGLKEEEEKARLAAAEAEVNAKNKSNENLSSMKESVLTHLKTNPTSNQVANPVSSVETPTDPNETSDALQKQLQQEEQDKKIRNDSISKRNTILSRPKKLNLSSEAIDNLKKSVQDKVKQPLESLLNSIHESEESDPSSTKRSGYASIQIKTSGTENNGHVIIQQGLSKDQIIGTTSLHEKQASLNLGQVIEGKNNLDIFNQVKSEKTRCYCMSIYSENWCGYLIICINIELDFPSADIIFTEWIKLHFNNLQEVDEYDYFEFKSIDFGLINQLISSADYSESLKINNCDLKVCFFPVDSSKMSLELNEEQTLIKLATETIACDMELNFSLQLHLPENKKYINYLPANFSLSQEKKKKLMSNKVFFLYIPLNFEKEFRRFLAEKTLRLLYENLNQKLSSSPL